MLDMIPIILEKNHRFYCVVPKNKRNMKDINVLASHKLNKKNKKLLKNRYKIEFTNNRLK